MRDEFGSHPGRLTFSLRRPDDQVFINEAPETADGSPLSQFRRLTTRNNPVRSKHTQSR